MQGLLQSDCLAILNAGSRVPDPAALVVLDPAELGLSRSALVAAFDFLSDRACFVRAQRKGDHFLVGQLSLQGQMRLRQLG